MELWYSGNLCFFLAHARNPCRLFMRTSQSSPRPPLLPTCEMLSQKTKDARAFTQTSRHAPAAQNFVFWPLVLPRACSDGQSCLAFCDCIRPATVQGSNCVCPFNASFILLYHEQADGQLGLHCNNDKQAPLAQWLERWSYEP